MATKVTEVGVPAKVVIVGTSKMTLHQRFSKLPKPTVIPKVRRIITKAAIYKPPKRAQPQTYYDEDGDYEEEEEEEEETLDEFEEGDAYTANRFDRRGGQRRRPLVQQHLSLADRLTRNAAYYRGRRGGGAYGSHRGNGMHAYSSPPRYEEEDEFRNFRSLGTVNRAYLLRRGNRQRGGQGFSHRYHRGNSSFSSRYSSGGGFRNNNSNRSGGGGRFGNTNKKTLEELDRELDAYMKRPSGSSKHQPIEF